MQQSIWRLIANLCRNLIEGAIHGTSLQNYIVLYIRAIVFSEHNSTAKAHTIDTDKFSTSQKCNHLSTGVST